MNLLRDLADTLRRHMAHEGYDVTKVHDDDHAALMLYHKMYRYTIEARPRQVLKAVGFECPSQHAKGIGLLENAIQRGDSLNPYRSKGIATLEARDGLLDYWGIHHFHLGTKLMEDGFVERTAELLFCLLDDRCAYFIKVATHDSSPWAKKELVDAIHINWPEIIRPYLLKDVVGVSPELNDADLAALREANVMSILKMQDGTFYLEPGLGNTTGGVHINDLRWADNVSRVAGAVEDQVHRDWQSIVENAKKLGYQLESTEPLLLANTAPFVYWDIVDPGSGYRFRRYVEN
ncbi:MAG: hypothetical protein OXP10_01285 [Chloroflexota bacterium]|nr:hypothetical protein [Chloroflexota bacterium]MDE2940968.1 hypothetical protein [Chloroflexota bacterium]